MFLIYKRKTEIDFCFGDGLATLVNNFFRCLSRINKKSQIKTRTGLFIIKSRKVEESKTLEY